MVSASTTINGTRHCGITSDGAVELDEVSTTTTLDGCRTSVAASREEQGVIARSAANEGIVTKDRTREAIRSAPALPSIRAELPPRLPLNQLISTALTLDGYVGARDDHAGFTSLCTVDGDGVRTTTVNSAISVDEGTSSGFT